MGQIKPVQIFYSYVNAGPGKVITNLKKGLELIGYSCVENGDFQDDCMHLCLSEHPILNSEKISKIFIGPNICTLPIDHKVVMEKRYIKYLVNSQWTYDCYKTWIEENKLAIWPVGIDTDSFTNVRNNFKLNDCLVYYKRRPASELNTVTSLLEKNGQSYVILQYGNYSEEQFKNLLSISKYTIILDGIESQGIAIQEIMSSNIPMLVWNLDFWNDRGEAYKFSASSVPYWSNECGFRFSNGSDIEESYRIFMNNIDNYQPRNYILRELTLKKTAENLVGILNGR